MDALLDAFDVLTARVDGLEHQLMQVMSIVDQPLSPAESLAQLKRLKEAMG